MTEPLTPREMDVWRCLAEGLTKREAAKRLGVKRSTVGSYRTTLYAKLGVNNAVRAALAAAACGLIKTPITLPPLVAPKGHKPVGRILRASRLKGVPRKTTLTEYMDRLGPRPTRKVSDRFTPADFSDWR